MRTGTTARDTSGRRHTRSGCAGRLLALLLCIGTGGAHAELLKELSLTVGGSTRTYDLYRPERRDAGPLPVIFLLHGHMGSADVMTGENRKAAPYRVWLDIAEREHLLLVIPDGEKGSDGYRGWHDCRADARTNPAGDDVAFIDALIEQVAAGYSVDRSRLYATGTSNGGNMVYRLAQERGAVFAAFAPVVAAMPVHNSCRAPDSPVSLLIMNGTEDPILPYAGGAVGRGSRSRAERGSVLSAGDSVRFWLVHNAIGSAAAVRELPDIDRRDGSTVRVSSWSGGEGGSEVLLYEVRGGGHTEPSLSQRYGRLYTLIVGPQNHDIEMAETVWRFFSRHTRRPLR